jgi:C-terminal processing protease CtpA/Prc
MRVAENTLPFLAAVLLAGVPCPAQRQSGARQPGALLERVGKVLQSDFCDAQFRQQDLPRLLDEYRLAARAAASRDEERAVVHALLGEVPASHLAIYSRATWRHLEAELMGTRTPMLGCSLLQLAGHFYVDSVYDGGPAERAGLRRGDEVAAIDGDAPRRSGRLDWRSDDAFLDDPPVHDLVVADGERVVLTIADARGARRDVAVTAAPYSGYAASRAGVREVEVAGHAVLCVHLWFVFHGRSASLLREALDDHPDCSALLLDLRGRGGSALECPGVVAAVRSARDAGLAVVALVDHRTRSAKEVIAYDLRKRGLATLVGERTAGAVLPATFAQVGDETVLMYPASRLGSYTAAIEGVGVQPHRVADDPLPGVPGRDPVFAAGLEVLAERFAQR